MIERYNEYSGEINVGLSSINLSKQQLVEKIKEYVPDLTITYSDYYQDPDKRDYIVSNKKIESTGWESLYSLDDGIVELIKTYKILISDLSSKYRNGFPLSYGVIGRSIYYKERSWNDFHFYSSEILTGGVKIGDDHLYIMNQEEKYLQYIIQIITIDYYQYKKDKME